MVNRGCFVFQPSNGGSSVVWTEGVGIAAAGDKEIDCCLTRNCDAARGLHGTAIIVQWISRDWVEPSTDRLARQVRILAQGRGKQLVNIALAAQVRALAADIRGC